MKWSEKQMTLTWEHILNPLHSNASSLFTPGASCRAHWNVIHRQALH